MVLAELKKLRHNPRARQSWSLFAGGFVWSDERRSWRQRQFDELETVMSALINCRAMLTLGKQPEPFVKAIWTLVEEACPDWPGFRPERRGSEVRAYLLESEAEQGEP